MKLPKVLALLATISVVQSSETLIHYRVNSGDSTSSIPNLGTLGNGVAAGSGVTYSFDRPFEGVPDGGGGNSIAFDGTGGVLAPGTQQLLNSTILANGGFTYEAWFKWNGSGDWNAIIDYAGTEKIFRHATNGLRMQTNNGFDYVFPSVPANEWRHIAVVFSNVTAATGTHITGDYTFYLNGGPTGSLTGVTITDFGDSLNRTIGVGTHPSQFSGDFFSGLIYEPKVTLGPLSPDELFFDATVTTLSDEDDGRMGGGNGISLREAIKYSPAGATITFNPNFAGGTIFLDETLGQISIPRDLTIDASDLFRPIGLSAQGNSRIFLIDGSSAVTLNNLVLSDGDGGLENGGAIFSSAGALTLIDCTIKRCHAPCGGAITNDATLLTLIRCTLSENTADTGGAICSGTAVVMEQCTLAENYAEGFAGAIANWGDLTLIHCTISDNTALAGAGGVGKFDGTLTLGYSIIAGNKAPDTPDLSGSIDTDQGSNLIAGSPRLSPLGDFGGKTETMLPLSLSPALNPVQPSGFLLDQRGFTRDFSPDIGAAEQPPMIQVSNNNDSGPGSLRDAISSAGPQGATILIGFNLEGQTITLTSGQIEIGEKQGLIIDGAQTFPGAPVIVSGDDTSRVFSVGFGSSVIMRDLTIANGFSGQGAGIYNGGHLDLIGCTIRDNETPEGEFFQGGDGGGLFNDVGQVLRLTGCTVSGNKTGIGVPGEGGDNGGFGAGIYNLGSLLLDRSTITGNSCASDGWGGGIFCNEAFVSVLSSTITGNSASRGGGIYADSNSLVRLRHSIASFNIASISSNIAGSFDQDGTNNITDDDPVLAPLGNYGGRTETMPPIAGSPAIGQAVGALHSFDQRGISVTGVPDLGATEYQDPAPTSLFWSDPAPIVFGTALSTVQLNASADNPGTISYSPQLGSVLAAGTYTLIATFTPDDPNFHLGVSANVTLIVNRASPVITWTEPSAITYGTPLSGAQLNASASNGASVTYSENAGQVLNAGSTQLTASLAETPNFNAASKSVTLSVSKAPLIVTADDKEREEGEANPTLTLSYTGFVNGDTDLDSAPTLSTLATVASAPGTYPITLSGGSDANYTLSFVAGKLTIVGLPISVSGAIWEDLDEDGIRSASDPGIVGAQVLIFDTATQGLLAMTNTASDGSYSLGELDGLTPGSYTLALNLPIGSISSETLWISTLRNQGGNEAVDSDLEPCDLAAGTCLTQIVVIPNGPLQWDAGLVEQGFNRGTVQGTLWNDSNQNSFFVGEGGFANATVSLLTAEGDRLRTVETDLNGSYQFLNVLPGEYRVRFEKPVGIDHFSAQFGDSEVNPADGTSDILILELGESVSVSAGISAEPPFLAFSQNIGILRTPLETAQGVRLHRDSETGEMSVRFTVLPLLRTADGTDFFPEQRLEFSSDCQTWHETDFVIPASSNASIREERIPVELTSGPTFFRIRVNSTNP